LKKLTLAVVAALFICTFTVAAKHPNIVVFLSDDQGWGDLSGSGNTNLSTPNIDSIARDGVKFESFYVCAVCSPTRAEFLTGRHHARGGVYSTSAGGERLDLDETTIADYFKAAGYRTAAYGKWHNGMQFPYHPNGRGFDEFYGFCSGHWGNYFDPMLEHNGNIVKGRGFCIDDFTNHGLEFIEKSVRSTTSTTSTTSASSGQAGAPRQARGRQGQAKPFLCYFAYNTPHSPMQVPDKYWDKFKEKKLNLHNRDPKREKDQHLRCALAMCENIDWNVGRVLKKLDDLEIADNTIVIYFSDNGPNGYRWNGDMRGRKGSTDEGGVRSPLEIRYPALIKPGSQIRQITSVTDLLPTLIEICAVDAKIKLPLDGISFVPWLKNPDAACTDRLIVNNWRRQVSVRSQRYRLDNKKKLYDMQNDFGQRIDISKKFPDVHKRLVAAANKFRTDVYSELPKRDMRPFVIAHPGHIYTQIPARDAKGSGGIKRSSIHPNCSYFTNWTKPEQTICWNVEVAANGVYEVELFYTCPEKDLGSTVELECGESKLKFKVTEEHDSPFIGAKQDRFKRIESYVKDWKRVTVGALKLREGKQILKLQASDIPGYQVMDFRLILLKKMK